MNIYNNIITRRSIRQFKQENISEEILRRLVNGGRLAPSASNLQPLEFFAVDDPVLRKKIFPCLKWAAYIAPKGNPEPGRQPVAYIFSLVNMKVRSKGYEYDVGAAMENMILTAWASGIASCWLLSLDRDRIRLVLDIPEHYKIDSVLALGYPDEESKIEDFSGSVEYWKDAQGLFHVPKRRLEEVIHYNRFGS